MIAEDKVFDLIFIWKQILDGHTDSFQLVHDHLKLISWWRHFLFIVFCANSSSVLEKGFTMFCKRTITYELTRWSQLLIYDGYPLTVQWTDDQGMFDIQCKTVYTPKDTLVF